MGKFVLGVDGGNTKTQYFLYDIAGNFVDELYAGTCSHEALPDSFAGTKRELGERTAELLGRNGVSVSDVGFAVFGLAGADFDWQKEKLTDIVKSLGFLHCIVENDGFLALKAGSRVGVACINGTGTVTVGVNEKGERLQIGGLGEISGDKAGASYIAMRGLRTIYDMLYRGGKHTVLKDRIFREFSIASEKDFAFSAVEILRKSENIYSINLMMEQAEREGDEAVCDVLCEIGIELARSVAGCIDALHFSGNVEVILAGSVWVKGKFTRMYDSFASALRRADKPKAVLTKLQQPPAIGAVIWALEEYRKQNGEPTDFVFYGREIGSRH